MRKLFDVFGVRLRDGREWTENWKHKFVLYDCGVQEEDEGGATLFGFAEVDEILVTGNTQEWHPVGPYVAAPPSPARVYFLRGLDTGRFKIGTSSDVTQRLKAIQTGCSERVEVVATVPGDESLERRLHERFKAARMHGEWFHPTTDLLAFVDGIMLGQRL